MRRLTLEGRCRDGLFSIEYLIPNTRNTMKRKLSGWKIASVTL